MRGILTLRPLRFLRRTGHYRDGRTVTRNVGAEGSPCSAHPNTLTSDQYRQCGSLRFNVGSVANAMPIMTPSTAKTSAIDRFSSAMSLSLRGNRCRQTGPLRLIQTGPLPKRRLRLIGGSRNHRHQVTTKSTAASTTSPNHIQRTQHEETVVTRRRSRA